MTPHPEHDGELLKILRDFAQYCTVQGSPFGDMPNDQQELTKTVEKIAAHTAKEVVALSYEKLDSYIRGYSAATNFLLGHDRETALKNAEQELLRLAGQKAALQSDLQQLKQRVERLETNQRVTQENAIKLRDKWLQQDKIVPVPTRLDARPKRHKD